MSDLETLLRQRLPSLAETDIDPAAALGPARLAARSRRRTAYAGLAAAACVTIGGGVVVAAQLGTGPAPRVALGAGVEPTTWGPFLGHHVTGTTWYLTWLASDPGAAWPVGGGPDLTLQQTGPDTVDWTMVADSKCTIFSGQVTFAASGQVTRTGGGAGVQGTGTDCLPHDPARAGKVLAAVQSMQGLGLTPSGRLVVLGAGVKPLAQLAPFLEASKDQASRMLPTDTVMVGSSSPYAGDWVVDYSRLSASGLDSGVADVAISGSGSGWKLTTGVCRDLQLGLTVTRGVIAPERSMASIDRLACPSGPSLSDAPVGEILDATHAIRTDASGRLYLVDADGILVASLSRHTP